MPADIRFVRVDAATGQPASSGKVVNEAFKLGQEPADSNINIIGSTPGAAVTPGGPAVPGRPSSAPVPATSSCGIY